MQIRAVWVLAALAAGGMELFSSLRTLQPSATAAVPAPSISSMGSIVALDLKSAPRNLSLLGKDGRILDLVIDPNGTVVLQGGKVTTLEHLKQGQKVKVYHALQDNQEVATSIHILEPEPMSPATVSL